MTNNDILRSLRYMLDLGDGGVVDIIRLADAGTLMDITDARALLKKDQDDGFIACTDRVLSHFLDGLVIHFRGRNDAMPARPPASRIDNNLVLKKLRVAFQLKDHDLHELFVAAGFPLARPELTALFRQPGHRHYRACGDQILRNFLKGLTLRFRGG